MDTATDTRQVHAFTGVQVLLQSSDELVRQRLGALVGGCAASRQRQNFFGLALSRLMQPVSAVLHAVRWTYGRAQWSRAGAGRMRRPALALHVRAMSDHRARNLSGQNEREAQLEAAKMCFARASRSATLRESFDSGTFHDMCAAAQWRLTRMRSRAHALALSRTAQ